MRQNNGIFLCKNIARKIHHFFCSFTLVLLLCLTPAHSAGYTCSTTKTYTSCNSGYYLSSGSCNLCSSADNRTSTTSCTTETSITGGKRIGSGTKTCNGKYTGGNAGSNGTSQCTGCTSYSTTCNVTSYSCSCNSGYHVVGSGSTCTCEPDCSTSKSCSSDFSGYSGTYNECTQNQSSQCYKSCSVTCSGNNTSACPSNATCTYNTSYQYSGTQYYGGNCSATAGKCPVSSFTCNTGYSKNSAGTACVPNTYKVTLDKQSGAGGTSEYYYQFNTKGTCYYYTTSALTACISGTSGDTITIPSRTGYTFGGYYTGKNGTGTQYVNASGGTVNNLFTVSAANITLYAKWTANTYKVTLDSQGATSAGTTAYWYRYATDVPCYYYTDSSLNTCMGSDGYTLTKPSKTGYTFGGYYTGTNGTGTQYIDANGKGVNNLYGAVAANSTLYAKWTANTYTVAYNANGGSGSTASSSHTYDVSKILTTNGFTNGVKKFLGWSTSASATSATYTNRQSVSNLTTTNGATITLYAIWGSCTSCSAGVGATCTLSAPLGVCTYTTGCNTGYGNITNSGAYNPACSANTYKVTLDSQGATSAGTTAYWYRYATAVPCYYYTDSSLNTCMGSDGYTLTKPIKTGYTFGGYYTGTNGTGTQYIDANGQGVNNLYGAVAANSTLYAKWTANIYKVTLDNQGAISSGTTAYWYQYKTQSPCFYYTDSALTTCISGTSGDTIIIPSKTGYTFGGYYTGTNGAGTQYVTSVGSTTGNIYASVAGNTTLYAKWTANQYTCEEAQYLNGTVCTNCETGYFCKGGTWTYNGGVQGRENCPPTAAGSDNGRNAATDCYVSCSAKSISNGTTTVVNAKEYYNGSAYPACTFNVNCNAKYGASGNKTSNPSCTLCATGKYSAGGANACALCNIPSNSTATSNASTINGCSWTCNSGYNQTADNQCGQFCGAGIRHLHLGNGVSIPLYSSARTSPAINVKWNNTVCYGSLSSGKSSGLNVKVGTTTYHAVN